MGRFDFSPEALDEGLTIDDVAEFENKCEDFAFAAREVAKSTASVEAVAAAVTSYLKLGEEVFAIFGKAVAAKAVQVEVPSTRKRLADTIRDQLTGVLNRFSSGKKD